MKKILFGGLMMTLLATSCKKDEPTGPAAGSYLTKTSGTTWNFRYTDLADPTANEDYTITASGRDTTAFGRTYSIFETTATDGENVYRTAIGNDYYSIANILGLPYETKYLVDNAAAGTSWTTPVNSVVDLQGQQATLNASVRNTVVSKGGTLTINGKTYTDVINTKIDISGASISLTIQGFPLNLPISFTTQNVNEYYAPKYGLIKRTTQLVASITFPGQPAQEVLNTNNTDELMSSSIQ